MGERTMDNRAQATEKQPLERVVDQVLVRQLCADNHLNLQVLPREAWERKDSIFRKTTLYLPTDLHIYEIPGVVEAMGYPQTKEKIQDLGRIFQNTGVYLAKRLHNIDEGKKVAQTKAEELFNFGESLLLQKKPRMPKTVEDISRRILTPQETEEIDRFWVSDEFYRSSKNTALARIENNPDKLVSLSYEEQRIKILNEVFKASQEDAEYQFTHRFGFTNSTEKPTHAPHITFIQDTFQRSVEYPLTELTNAIVRHGMSKSTTELPTTITNLQERMEQILLKYGRDINPNDLYQLLQIDQFKNQIELSRQKNKFRDVNHKERNLANYIQKVTYIIAHQEKKDTRDTKSPEEISVKATSIGVDLMQKAGLNPLVISTSGYSTILLITPDYRIKLMDMTTVMNNKSITHRMLQGSTISDIIAFSRTPQLSGLRLIINHNDLLSKITLTEKQKIESFTVYSPEQGQKISSLFNRATSYYDQASNDKTLETTKRNELFQMAYITFEKIMESSPQDDNLWYNYGVAIMGYLNTNPDGIPRTELLRKAKNAYEQATKLNPENGQAHFQLGEIFEKSFQNEKAAESYRKALKAGDKEARRKQRYIKKYLYPLKTA